MTPSHLASLRKIAEGATPRWTAHERAAGSIFREYEIRDGGGVLFRSTSYGNMDKDAAHIAAFSPQTAIQLIDEIEKLQKKVDWYKAGDIHTCHEECMRTACVLRRENDRMREALEWYADPDRLDDGDRARQALEKMRSG